MGGWLGGVVVRWNIIIHPIMHHSILPLPSPYLFTQTPHHVLRQHLPFAEAVDVGLELVRVVGHGRRHQHVPPTAQRRGGGLLCTDVDVGGWGEKGGSGATQATQRVDDVVERVGGRVGGSREEGERHSMRPQGHGMIARLFALARLPPLAEDGQIGRGGGGFVALLATNHTRRTPKASRTTYMPFIKYSVVWWPPRIGNRLRFRNGRWLRVAKSGAFFASTPCHDHPQGDTRHGGPPWNTNFQ